MIGIIDYGCGNLQSVQNALESLRIPNCLVSTYRQVKVCTKLILPGVGAFGQAMEKLSAMGFIESLKEWVAAQKPLLGICLGMQLLFDSSCELGEYEGLGFISGRVQPLKEKVKRLPMPHMGWNNILKLKDDSKLLSGISNNESFYYLHSYYCDPADRELIAAQSEYGVLFASVVEYGLLYGCQFHPEKSQKAGLRILENFWKIC